MQQQILQRILSQDNNTQKWKNKFPNTQVEETWMFQHPITHQIGKINSQQKGKKYFLWKQTSDN